MQHIYFDSSNNMSNKKLPKWIELSSYSQASWNSSQPIAINNTEFIRWSGSNRFKVPSSMDVHIHKYNIENDTWDEFVKYPFSSTTHSMIAFDIDPQILYVYSSEGLEKINIKTNKSKRIENVTEIGNGARSLIFDNQLHVIGGTDNLYHLIWNNKQHKFDTGHKFPFNTYNLQSGFVHIKSKNILLLLGGYDKHDAEYDLDSIYSYNIQQKKWILLPQKLPIPLSYFGCVLSKDDKYLIIMGGTSDDDFNQLNDIYVLNTNNMEFKKSKIDCPEKSNYHAINMDNKENIELLIFGFVRSWWNLYPPNELLMLISCFYATEYIHLMSTYGNHWKIELNTIVNNLYDN
eukprot:280970_1